MLCVRVDAIKLVHKNRGLAYCLLTAQARDLRLSHRPEDIVCVHKFKQGHAWRKWIADRTWIGFWVNLKKDEGSHFEKLFSTTYAHTFTFLWNMKSSSPLSEWSSLERSSTPVIGASAVSSDDDVMFEDSRFDNISRDEITVRELCLLGMPEASFECWGIRCYWFALIRCRVYQSYHRYEGLEQKSPRPKSRRRMA